MRVVFIKATDMVIYKAVVGTIVNLRGKKLEEQMSLGNVEPYKGPWPPKIEHRKPDTKKKINLKDLK